MNRSFAFTLAAMCVFGIAGTAAAIEPPHDKKHPMEMKSDKEFKKFDREKHHKDMEKRHEEMFAKTDKNGDGALSKDEFLDAHKQRALEAFDALDTNKDGSLSKEELQEGRKHWRKKMGDHKGKFGKPMEDKPVQK